MELLHGSDPSDSESSSDETARTRRYHVASFGCRASQSESASIEAELRTAGRLSSASPFHADVIVINSCTVTSEADRDVDRLIRRVNRRNPTADIIVTGCYAQRSPDDLAGRPQVRYVVGNSHKRLVSGLAEDCLDDPVGPGRSEVFCSEVFELLPLEHQGSAGRTRATVKVQDGCNANCSFCIIPAVRGRSRSLAAPLVIRQVRDLVAAGYREVVFSGIHLGSWGRDRGSSETLVDLIADTLASVPQLERLRLSSIEPLEVTEGLVELASSEPRIARHLHVPMQSGSRRILRAMRRPYTPADYGERVRRIHDAMPAAAVGADVMVGFPGETDEEFLETFSLVESLPLSYLHVFPYSSRPGTPAAALEDRVPAHVVRFRARRLATLGREKNRRFRRQFVGQRLHVLALGGEDASEGRGLSDNFIGVRLDPELQTNRWHDVEILAEADSGLLATCDSPDAEQRNDRENANQDSRMTTAAEIV